MTSCYNNEVFANEEKVQSSRMNISAVFHPQEKSLAK